MSIEDTKNPPSKTESLFRLLTFSVAFFTVVSALPQAEFHPFIIITLCVLFFYVNGGYYFETIGNQAVQGNRIYRSADAMILASTVAFINFAPLPSSMICVAYFVALLGYSSAYRYIYVLIFLAASGLGLLFLPITTILSDTSTLIVFLMVALYFAFAIKFNRNENIQLLGQLDSTNKEKLELARQSFYLSKYLSPTIRRAMLSGERIALEPKDKNITIFF